MRQVESKQAELGGTFISEVRINPKSRDDTPVLLRGLQHIYQKQSVRVKVFEFLSARLYDKVRHDTGRPGMDWWRILVLATLKQGFNCDYDRLAELANEQCTLRQMLGHGIVPHHYNRQTIADNVRLLTPQLLDEISQLVVREEHQAAGKEPDAALRGRADSFWTIWNSLTLRWYVYFACVACPGNRKNDISKLRSFARISTSKKRVYRQIV